MKRLLLLSFLLNQSISALTLPTLTEQDVLGEQLLSYRYDLLRDSLRKDATTLVSGLSSDELAKALAEDEVKTRILLLSILNKLPAKDISNRAWTAKHRDFLTCLLYTSDAADE